MKSSLPVTCAAEIKHKPQILNVLLWKRSLSCLSRRSEIDDEAADIADRRKDIKINLDIRIKEWVHLMIKIEQHSRRNGA